MSLDLSKIVIYVPTYLYIFLNDTFVLNWSWWNESSKQSDILSVRSGKYE